MRLGVLGLAPVAAAVCLVEVAGGAGTASFSDSAGDSGEAPDVISITVANDDQGLISFTVTIANRATFGPDDAVAIPFATNAPGRAGVREDGVNFVLGLEGTQGAFLERWTGADMVVVRPAPSSLRGSFADGVVTLTVRQDDLVPGFPSLAVPTELSFYVLGVSFNGAVVVAEDDAPDASDQFWSYRLVQPPRIIVTYFRAPKIAKPGAVLVARVGAAWSDTGRVVKPTKVSCRAKLGSRVLKGRASAPVLCSWTLPTHSAGMTLRGTVTLTSSGMSVTRSFTTRVR